MRHKIDDAAAAREVWVRGGATDIAASCATRAMFVEASASSPTCARALITASTGANVVDVSCEPAGSKYN